MTRSLARALKPVLDTGDQAVGKLESHEAYFRRRLGDIDEPTAPFGLLGTPGSGANLLTARHTLGPALAAELHALAARFQVDTHSLFHLAGALVLARLCARDEVVFGTALADRILPLRLTLAHDSARAGLRQTHMQRAELAQHADAEPALAQACSAVPAPTPLFSAALLCRNSSEVDAAHGHVPCTLTVNGGGDGFELIARLPAPLDPRRLCTGFQYALEQLADVLANAPETPLARIDVLPADERRRLLVEWNAVQAPHRLGGSVQALVEGPAVDAPDAPALVDGDVRLSHSALHAQANRLAHHLRGLGVGPDVRVAVCMQRSADLVIALLAILKAGGAYVPLDPLYPAERLAYMLNDSVPAAVLTHPAVPEPVQALLRMAMDTRPVIDLHAEAAPWQACPSTPLYPKAVGVTPDHLAYVAYTSGSTGQPKGVANTIAGLANRLAWFVDAIASQAAEPLVTGMKTSICFVDSVTEMLQTLAAGGRLVVFDAETAKDTERFAQQVRQHGVTMLVVVPSLLTQLLDIDARAFASVRTLICSGERLAPELARAVRAAHPGARLFNFYGSSEVNGEATFHDCSGDADAAADAHGSAASPIGRPIANLRVYLLDHRMRPVPVGVIGEMFVGGVGLARGYLGRADLTAERFLDDPFVPGARIYKTGDLARYRDDGVLEFAGRNDHQVKIRGFRIELGEVEAAIRQHPGVQQVVVMGREDVPGDMRLVAYLTTEGSAGAELVDGVRYRLRENLPDYMMPSLFVRLDAMPMTPSGKLDRMSLPAPTLGSERGAQGPRNELEAAVARIVAEVLKADHIGVGDDFFLVGGHSLLAARLVGRLNRELGLRLNLRALFENPTVEKLARLIRLPRPEVGGSPSAAESAADTLDVLSLIRPGKGGTPVFFVHDGFGETLAYRSLAHLLSPDLPVYGVYPLAAHGVGMVHTRITEMAAHYIERVRSVQSQGPYLLAGLCAGGVVAFEMARQLEQKGQAIGAVVLIDANDVAARKRIGRYALGQVRRHGAELAQRASWSRPLASVRAGFDFAGEVMRMAGHQIGSRAVAAWHNRQARKLQAVLDKGEAPPPSLRKLSVDQIYNLAERNHADPGSLNADVLLVRATQGNGDIGDEPFVNLYSDPLLGWGRRVRGTVHAIDLPGGHYSVFQPPHVQALAACMQAHIDSALAR
jgi:amino acid adenylation domain-containing protein